MKTCTDATLLPVAEAVNAVPSYLPKPASQ